MKGNPIRPRREFAVLRNKMQTSGLSAWAGRPDDPGPSQRIRDPRSREMKGHDQFSSWKALLPVEPATCHLPVRILPPQPSSPAPRETISDSRRNARQRPSCDFDSRLPFLDAYRTTMAGAGLKFAYYFKYLGRVRTDRDRQIIFKCLKFQSSPTGGYIVSNSHVPTGVRQPATPFMVV